MRMSTDFVRSPWRTEGYDPHATGFRQRWLSRLDDPELMDGDGYSADELRTNFRDIQRVNRWFGGTSTILTALSELIPPGATKISLLDLATGVADIPLAVQRWCDGRGYEAEIMATDVSPQILALAKAEVAGSTRIHLQQTDARALPFENDAFDIVTCSLALHHFAPADAAQVLREMDRVCRTGFIVNDLRRGVVGYGATWLASRLTTRNRLTRHDAPLSIKRAYTPAELRALLDDADVQNVSIKTLPWFRMVAVKRAAND